MFGWIIAIITFPVWGMFLLGALAFFLGVWATLIINIIEAIEKKSIEGGPK